MSRNIKLSFSLFLNIVVVSIMCAILLASLSLLNGELFKSGYVAYVTNEKGKTVEKYTHYLKDGDDKKSAEFEKEGLRVTKVSVTSKTGKVVDYIVYTALSLFILTVFVYDKTYTVGNKDQNAVRCGHYAEDKLRGLKVGILAVSPDIIFFIVYVVLRFVRPSTSVGYFKIFNVIYLKILNSAMGQHSLANVPIWGFIVMLAVICFVPIVAHISYTLGYKDIKISDKLTYKKGEIK
ncbi:MAG: hypothetical protein J5766_04665 [Clostridia bacterium]|nr:hypothetical protein [Clostridia bacterium]